MKKIMCTLLVIGTVFNLIACSNNTTSKSNQVQSSVNSEVSSSVESKEQVDDKENLPEITIPETGGITFEISTSGGSSENGAIPVEFTTKTDAELSGVAIGIYARDFDGSKLSYIYVDGKLAGKEQLADTQTTLDITGQGASFGKHMVQVVQYDEQGKISVYKEAQYEVKEK